jgi:hypothetical protein
MAISMAGEHYVEERPKYEFGKYPYVVVCDEHGPQVLFFEEYNDQMDNPDAFWKCPICRSAAEWSDSNLDEFYDHHDEYDEPRPCYNEDKEDR